MDAQGVPVKGAHACWPAFNSDVTWHSRHGGFLGASRLRSGRFDCAVAIRSAPVAVERARQHLGGGCGLRAVNIQRLYASGGRQAQVGNSFDASN